MNPVRVSQADQNWSSHFIGLCELHWPKKVWVIFFLLRQLIMLFFCDSLYHRKEFPNGDSGDVCQAFLFWFRLTVKIKKAVIHHIYDCQLLKKKWFWFDVFSYIAPYSNILFDIPFFHSIWLECWNPLEFHSSIHKRHIHSLYIWVKFLYSSLLGRLCDKFHIDFHSHCSPFLSVVRVDLFE